MKQFQNYTRQNNSREELRRLEELQQGIAKEMAEKKYSEQEKKRMEEQKKSMKFASDRFRNNLNTEGRAQPLRANNSKFSNAKKKISKINVVTNILSKIDWSNDGLYFVVFMVSVIGDIGTMAIGAVQAIPGVGWALGAVFGMATESFVFMISAIIMLLYIMNGHYKRRKVIIKIAVLMGFSILELIPIATALPGFVGSFIINYAIVLYGRAMDEALARNSMTRKMYTYTTNGRQKIQNARARAWK